MGSNSSSAPFSSFFFFFFSLLLLSLLFLSLLLLLCVPLGEIQEISVCLIFAVEKVVTSSSGREEE